MRAEPVPHMVSSLTTPKTCQTCCACAFEIAEGYEKKGSMKLIHVGDIVKEVFEITGFTDILTIE